MRRDTAELERTASVGLHTAGGGTAEKGARYRLCERVTAVFGINHRVEVEGQPPQRFGRVGDVPAPHPARSRGGVARRWPQTPRGAPWMMRSLGRTQHPVEGRPRGRVEASVGEAWDDPARRRGRMSGRRAPALRVRISVRQ